MNVVYTFDDGYASITAVSLYSLLESNKDLEVLNIYIVDCGLSDENKDKITSLIANYDRKIFFVDGKNLQERIPIKLDLLYWSFVCYVRLFFSELFPNLDRVLHIDCDTIVRGKINEIYDLDLGDNYCAACYDCVPSSKYAIGMDDSNKYYSNGLILFDLKKMRDNNILKKFIDYIVKMKGKLPHLDQDVLNVVLENKIYTLHPKYNMMTINLIYREKNCDFFDNSKTYYTKNEIREGLKNPIIIHFVGYKYTSRPWARPCYTPYKNEWVKMYKKTNFDLDNRLLKFKKKKYGLFREIICFMWNIGNKIPIINYILFNHEKKRIKNKCNQ